MEKSFVVDVVDRCNRRSQRESVGQFPSAHPKPLVDITFQVSGTGKSAINRGTLTAKLRKKVHAETMTAIPLSAATHDMVVVTSERAEPIQ